MTAEWNSALLKAVSHVLFGWNGIRKLFPHCLEDVINYHFGMSWVRFGCPLSVALHYSSRTNWRSLLTFKQQCSVGNLEASERKVLPAFLSLPKVTILPYLIILLVHLTMVIFSCQMRHIFDKTVQAPCMNDN
jgi:hypothetical protein